jgi:NTP pyrophosphatase (non-canonical NTP hydrolase)
MTASEAKPTYKVESVDSTWVGLNEFQHHTLLTDQNVRTGIEGLRLPLLGLFGEVGSLLSALKKKRRDVESYIGYNDAILEEFGDVLWYFANIASRANLDLSITAQRMFRGLDDWDQVESHEFGTFADIQPRHEFLGPLTTDAFEDGLVRLAGKVGRLLDDVAKGHVTANRDGLSAHLVEILRAIVDAADNADIDLDEAAKRNVEKTLSRWPTTRVFVPPFDLTFDIDEQLPRHIEIQFVEKEQGGKLYVIQKRNGVIIGDRLTDNKVEQDDYRFHDVFHLAYAAILGWSPVTRALFRVKRKSRSDIDENEDGARAILIEEGISTWVFNHAIKLDFFSNIKTLDYSLLKAVKQQVSGYEVQSCPLWEWELAILEGYKVFRELRRARKGWVVADMNQRSLEFREL